MKKVITVIIAIALTATLAVFVVNAAMPKAEVTPIEKTKNGDVDYNGSITLVDAMKMMLNVAGKEQFDDFTQKVGDLNKTGEVDISDAIVAFRYVAGKGNIPLFPLFEDQEMPYDPSTEYYTPKSEQEKLIEEPQFDGFDMQVRGTEVVMLDYTGTATEVVVPDGVTRIESMAFYYKTAVEKITIPSTVTYIGSQAFAGCLKLKTINIPSSVTTIARRAFNCCTELEEINIPKTVNLSTNDTFSGCYKLKDAVFTNNITALEYRAYYYCTGLSTVVIPSGVTSIGQSAFAFSSVSDITIPSSVTSADDSAFANCMALSVIRGVKGSYAEALAQKLGISFVEVA